MVTEWATTGKRSHRRPRPCNTHTITNTNNALGQWDKRGRTDEKEGEVKRRRMKREVEKRSEDDIKMKVQQWDDGTWRQQMRRGMCAMMTLLDVLDCSFSDSLVHRFSAPGKSKTENGAQQLLGCVIGNKQRQTDETEIYKEINWEMDKCTNTFKTDNREHWTKLKRQKRQDITHPAPLWRPTPSGLHKQHWPGSAVWAGSVHCGGIQRRGGSFATPTDCC